MLRSKIYLIMAVLVFSIFSFSTTQAFAGVAQPSKDEIIAEVSRISGLASDLTKTALESEPKLLENFGKAVFMAKVMNNLLEARDSEAMAELFNHYTDQAFDFFAERALNPTLLHFLGVVKIYKTSLEMIRDYILIPRLNQGIYNRYKAARQFGKANPSEAFGPAVDAYLSGYHMLKDQWYQKLIKAKGYNPKLIGGRLEQSLRSKVDRFWIGRLESRYQQERLRSSKKFVTRSIWVAMKPEFARLKTLAGGKTVSRAGFFLTPADFPPGWWELKGHFAKHTKPPHKIKSTSPNSNPSWMQSFPISDATGYKLNKKTGNYYRKYMAKTASGKTTEHISFNVPRCWVTVVMLNRFIDHNGKKYDWGKDSIEARVEKLGFQYLGNKRAACIKRGNNHVEIAFIWGTYQVTVRAAQIITADNNQRADIGKYEKLLHHFARKIASRLPDSGAGN